MTPTDLAGLCERLRAERLVDNSFGGGKFIRTNPDGPEAAAAIESLVAGLKMVRDSEPYDQSRLALHNLLQGLRLVARTALEGASDDR